MTNSRQFTALLPALLSLAVLGVASCTGADPGSGGLPVGGGPKVSTGPGTSASGSPSNTSPTKVGGSVVDTGASGSTTTTNPTETPRPTATPTESPTPATPGPVTALSVKVTPATASITLKPANSSATPLYPGEIQLSAQVILSNSLATDSVTWSSSSTDSATVTSAGLVKSGTAPGTVSITASSVVAGAGGSKATASCIVNVNGDGAVSLKLK